MGDHDDGEAALAPELEQEIDDLGINCEVIRLAPGESY